MYVCMICVNTHLYTLMTSKQHIYTLLILYLHAYILFSIAYICIPARYDPEERITAEEALNHPYFLHERLNSSISSSNSGGSDILQIYYNTTSTLVSCTSEHLCVAY